MKKLLILFLLVTSFYSCKNDTKNEAIEPETEVTDTKGLTLLKGDFVYYADAAVLQTKHEVYGVVIDKKMHELDEQTKTYKKAETDMIPVEIKGKIIQKPEGEEGWPFRIEIKEIINVSKPDPNKEEIILGADK
ncbi:hypothetical protein OS188_00295 [Xanthomarina sp. F1114]|uniref:hypothetical protein n=1 Tax=Xanthomarina sp. F1114 TaxID=2996019 RepID=UPI00225E4B78|nr:hypothetical protein [Xanthomarina sp. F1114]MCX7546383.1 hypothetical protein [Xanthomarina sp. F1114]